MKFFKNSFIRHYTKELVAIRLQELRGDYLLLKGRSVKYIRRIPTGQPKRPYIYIYASDSPEKRRAKLQFAKDLHQKRQPKSEKRQSNIFDSIANKIKSIFPSAEPKKDFSEYEMNGGTLSKEEYAKIALDYFQNKEKYDRIEIKVKDFKDKQVKEPGQEKPKVKRETKELTEEEIALRDKQRQRRLIIKQLKAKYGGATAENNFANMPESEPEEIRSKIKVVQGQLSRSMDSGNEAQSREFLGEYERLAKKLGQMDREAAGQPEEVSQEKPIDNFETMPEETTKEEIPKEINILLQDLNKRLSVMGDSSKGDYLNEQIAKIVKDSGAETAKEILKQEIKKLETIRNENLKKEFRSINFKLMNEKKLSVPANFSGSIDAFLNYSYPYNKLDMSEIEEIKKYLNEKQLKRFNENFKTMPESESIKEELSQAEEVTTPEPEPTEEPVKEEMPDLRTLLGGANKKYYQSLPKEKRFEILDKIQKDTIPNNDFTDNLTLTSRIEGYREKLNAFTTPENRKTINAINKYKGDIYDAFMNREIPQEEKDKLKTNFIFKVGQVADLIRAGKFPSKVLLEIEKDINTTLNGGGSPKDNFKEFLDRSDMAVKILEKYKKVVGTPQPTESIQSEEIKEELDQAEEITTPEPEPANRKPTATLNDIQSNLAYYKKLPKEERFEIIKDLQSDFITDDSSPKSMNKLSNARAILNNLTTPEGKATIREIEKGKPEINLLMKSDNEKLYPKELREKLNSNMLEIYNFTDLIREGKFPSKVLLEIEKDINTTLYGSGKSPLTNFAEFVDRSDMAVKILEKYKRVAGSQSEAKKKSLNTDAVNLSEVKQPAKPNEEPVNVKQDEPANIESERGQETKKAYTPEEVKKIASQAVKGISSDNRPTIRRIINGIFTVGFKANISLKRVKRQLDELIQTAGGIPADIRKYIYNTITGKELKQDQDLGMALNNFVESAYQSAWEKYKNTDVVKTNPKMFKDLRENEDKEANKPVFNKSSFFLIQKGLKGSTGRNVKYKQRIPTGHEKTPYIYIYDDDTPDVVKRKKEQADALKREVKGQPLKQEKVVANTTPAESKKEIVRKITIPVDNSKSKLQILKQLQVGDVVTMKNGIKFEVLSTDSKGMKRKITLKDGTVETRYTETRNIASTMGWVIDRSITETVVEEKQPEPVKPTKKDIKPEVVEQPTKPIEKPVEAGDNFESVKDLLLKENLNPADMSYAKDYYDYINNDDLLNYPSSANTRKSDKIQYIINNFSKDNIKNSKFYIKNRSINAIKRQLLDTFKINVSSVKLMQTGSMKGYAYFNFKNEIPFDQYMKFAFVNDKVTANSYSVHIYVGFDEFDKFKNEKNKPIEVKNNFDTMPESEPVKQDVKRNSQDYEKALKQKDNKAIFSKNLVSGLNIDPSVLYDWSKTHNVDIVWHAHILKNPANVEGILDDIQNNKFDRVKTLIEDYKNRKQEVSKPIEKPKDNFDTMPESEIAYKSIKAKIQLAKFDKTITETKKQYIDYQEEYLKHLEKSKKVFKDSKEISMYLLKEYDNYTGRGKTSDGFENTNFKKPTLQSPTKTAYRKEGDIKTQTNTGTVSDQANKQSVGQSKQIAVEKLKMRDQYTKKEHFDRPVIDGIKKSILESGYNPAFPITVDQDGFVVDGHHRASAVMELLEEGKVSKDFPVSIIQKNYTSEADRLLDQLSANEMRREVLILDKAKAYATLLKQGKTAEEIGSRNNKSPADIKSIASLENLVPEIKGIITAEFMRDRKGKKPAGTVEEQETESFSIPVGVAVAIAKNGLNDDGTPNGTLQRKALNWFKENRQKGARGTQVASYIRELKEAQSGGFFTQEESTSASQREAMDIIGSEEKAKRNVSSIQKMQNNILKELTKVAGDNIQNVNKKALKEIAASVIATKGSAELMIAGLKQTLRDFELLINGIETASKEIESDAQTPSMFGKSKYSSYKFKPESKETILNLKKVLIRMRLEVMRLERSLELYE
jgi:hypothetical protein